MKEKLSIIIPVYNDEKYLKRCLDSIINLDYENLEIILVDDGSTDDSLAIMTDYAAEDERIKAISQQNLGVSVARNTGLAQATGDYIMFVDADDYVLSPLKIVLNDEQTADLNVFGFESGEEQKVVKESYYDAENALQAKKLMMENPTQYMTAWGKIFRHDLIKKHNLRFNTNLRVAEDGKFMLQYLLKCETIKFSLPVGYHYSKDTESVMTTFDRKSEDYLIALEESARDLEGCPSEIGKAFSVYVMMHFNIIMVHETFASANPIKYGLKIKQLKQILDKPIFKEALADIKMSDCHGIRMLPVMLLKMHAYRLASILFIVRAKQNEKQVKEK